MADLEKAAGAPVLLCATRAEAVPIVARLKVRARIPGTPRYVLWGRLDGREPVIVGVSGMGGTAAAELTQWVYDALTPSCLIWFGVAGGLAPSLKSADLVIPAKVRIHPDPFNYQPAAALRELLVEAARRSGHAPGETALTQVGEVIASAAAKARAGEEGCADACDMESGDFARVASRLPVPWAVIRSIFDPVYDNLPPIAGDLLDDRGGLRPLPALREFLKSPGAMLGLRRRNQMAMAALTPVLLEGVRGFARQQAAGS